MYILYVIIMIIITLELYGFLTEIMEANEKLDKLLKQEKHTNSSKKSN